MTSQYFEQLGQDFSSLGLTDRPVEVRRYMGLYSLLKKTEAIDPGAVHPDGAEALQPMTALGRTILHYMTQEPSPPPFDSARLLVSCAAAEGVLLESLEQDDVENKHSFAPIIITKGVRPVGIIKTQGEKSCYALKTEAEVGLVKGAFAEPADLDIMEKAGLSEQAWSMPLEAAGQFAPIRFSIYAVPASERSKLMRVTSFSEDRRILATTQTQIEERAWELLADAVPLELQPKAKAA